MISYGQLIYDWGQSLDDKLVVKIEVITNVTTWHICQQVDFCMIVVVDLIKID